MKYIAKDFEKVQKHMEEYLLRQKRLQIRHFSIVGGVSLIVMVVVMLLAL